MKLIRELLREFMKKIVFTLGLCVILSLGAYSAEVTISSPAGGFSDQMEEVNSSFSQITPKPQKNVFKNFGFSSRKKTEADKVKPEKAEQKENIHTVKPAEKTIKSEAKESEKEEKLKQKQELEKEQYRQLQELSNQYQQGVALYTDNNLKASLEVFTGIPEDKRTPEVWLLMGNIMMDQGKKEEAAFLYGRAIITDSTFYKAYYNLGNIYLNDDKYNMAIEQYKMAGKYNPNNPYVFYNLGCAYLKVGDLKKAKSAFIRALEIKNTVADFHYNLAYTYKKLGKEKLAKTYLNNYNKLTGEID